MSTTDCGGGCKEEVGAADPRWAAFLLLLGGGAEKATGEAKVIL